MMPIEKPIQQLVPEVSIRNLNFYYGKTLALKNINLEIFKGKVTAFIGPSGCGKSTLLRTINRMYDLYPGQHAEGELIVGGQNILDRGVDTIELRAKVGMVFQKPTPFPMSIYENIAFGVRLHQRVSKAEMDLIVESALTRAALWDEVKDKLHQSGLGLSGGQQQRLCVARGIAVEPEVLLLDEPASALDPLSTAKLEATLVELKESFSIVIVTHNLQQAARISDYTAFMLLGRLIEFRPSADAFIAPETEAMRDYVTGRFG